MTLEMEPSDEASWKNWRVSDWNAALLSEIFRNPDNLGRPIKRITATSRFLAKIAKANESDAELVKEYFLKSFGSSSNQIRLHFKFTPHKKASLNTDDPAFFAQLYLTLLAGSADEKTFGEPDFRKRFALLMSHANVTSFQFESLAVMWIALAQWSEKQAAQGICRTLILPDPKNENRIGFSKRLAFPSFLDETKLAQLLSNAKDTTDWNEVKELIARNLSIFSDAFLEEFYEFTKTIASNSLEQAMNLPLWAAVQDLSWDLELLSREKLGKFKIVLDLSDLNNPWIEVQSDERGLSLLSYTCRLSNLPQESDGYRSIELHSGEPWNPQDLQDLVLHHREMTGTSLGKAIENKRLLFLPDEYGRLSTVGKYTSGCRVCLIVSSPRAQLLKNASTELAIDCLILDTQVSWGNNRAVYFPSLGENDVLKLTHLEQDSLFRTIYVRSSPNPITVAGGSWLGKILLLNPASAPKFSMRKASFGTFEIINNENQKISGGRLTELGDSSFEIPPKHLAYLDSPTSVKITLISDPYEKHANFFGSAELSEGPAKRITTSSRWRLEDKCLNLADVSPDQLTPICSNAPPDEPADAKDNAVNHVWFGTNKKALGPVVKTDYENIHPAIRWMWDALALRFQYTQTINYSDLMRIAGAAAQPLNVNAHHLIRLLSAAGWIVRLYSAKYQAVSYACGTQQLFIRTAGDEIVCRLLGPISTSYWNRIKSNLEKQRVSPTVLLTISQQLTLGAVEFRIPTNQNITDFPFLKGLGISKTTELDPPLEGPELIWLERLSKKKMSQTAGSNFNSYKYGVGWVEVDLEGDIARGEKLYPVDKRYNMCFIHDGDHFVVTQSEFLANALSLEYHGQYLAYVSEDSWDITFNKTVSNVPRLLTRWLLANGRGSVLITDGGCIAYSGEESAGTPAWLRRWCGPQHQQINEEIPSQRLRLALKKRNRHASITHSLRSNVKI